MKGLVIGITMQLCKRLPGSDMSISHIRLLGFLLMLCYNLLELELSDGSMTDLDQSLMFNTAVCHIVCCR